MSPISRSVYRLRLVGCRPFPTAWEMSPVGRRLRNCRYHHAGKNVSVGFEWEVLGSCATLYQREPSRRGLSEWVGMLACVFFSHLTSMACGRWAAVFTYGGLAEGCFAWRRVAECNQSIGRDVDARYWGASNHTTRVRRGWICWRTETCQRVAASTEPRTKSAARSTHHTGVSTSQLIRSHCLES